MPTWFYTRPIRSQLFLLVFVLAVPAIMLLGWLLVTQLQQTSTEAHVRVHTLAEDTAVNLQSHLHRNQAILTRLAALSMVRTLQTEPCNTVLTEFGQLQAEFANLRLQHDDGTLICSSAPWQAPPAWHEAAAKLAGHMAQRPATISNLVPGTASTPPLIILAQHVAGIPGQQHGILLLSIDARKLSDELFSTIPPLSSVNVVDQQQRVVLRSHDLDHIIGQSMPANLSRYQQANKGLMRAIGRDGTYKMYATASMRQPSWTILAGMPQDQVMKNYYQTLIRSLVIGAMMLVWPFILAWWLGTTIINPISALAQTAKRIADGDTSVRAKPGGPPETRAVAEQFNLMLDARDRHERALREGEERNRALIRAIPDLIFINHLDGQYIAYHAQAEELLYAPPSKFLGKTIVDILPPELAQRFMHAIAETHASGRNQELNYLLPMKGEEKYYEARFAPFDPDTVLTIVRDVSAHRRAELALQSSLKEKVALLNEVHHRVKNNLQVITSLLRLEAARTTEPATRTVLYDMKDRIRSMALLHEALYRAGEFSAIDLGTYLIELATHAFRTLTVQPGKISLKLDLASIKVGMDQATPCGLLVNELISNCLKHAFPDGRTGEVRIGLKTTCDADHILLSVADNGVGLPADFELTHSRSLGLQLIGDLTCQLNGRLSIITTGETRFEIAFLRDPPKPVQK